MTRSLAERLREQLELDTKSDLESTFAEEPASLDVFVRDKKYLQNPPLSAIQYDAVRHLEQIFFPELYPDMVEQFGDYWAPVRFINFAELEWGKGSGKDHICRVASLRLAHLLLCLRNPQAYYSMPPQDSIHLLNVASSAGQAYRAFFEPMRRAVERPGGWFSDKAHASVGSIVYRNNIEAISGHSDAETQEGLNLLLGVADEIDAFKSKDEVEQARGKGMREPTKSAEGIINMLRSSARTRFPQTFKIALISYPRFLGSTIQRRRQLGQADLDKLGAASKHYPSGPYATWDVNPRVKGKEDFQEEYDEDPAMARAKYECKPELSTDPFFKNSTAIYQAFSKELDIAPIELEYEWGSEVIDGQAGLAWIAKHTVNIVPIQGAQYAMHADLAVNGDRAGIAMAHVKEWREFHHVTQDEEGGDIVMTELRPVVKLDFSFAYSGSKTSLPMPREIQIRWGRQLCWALMKRGFDIKRFTFDGFQSTDSMQQLEARGIESERVSTDTSNDAWNNLRDLAYDGRLEAYYRDSAVTELLALTRLPNGRIDHPPYGSKDEADAIAGACLGAVLLGGNEGDKPEEAHPGDDVFEAFGSPTRFERISAMPSDLEDIGIGRSMPL